MTHEYEEELEQCAECGYTWPVSELEDGVCPDCLLERHYESLRRRREDTDYYYQEFDEFSDADPGL
jgi:hypothetical protein